MAPKKRITPLPKAVDVTTLDDEAHIRVHTVSRETALAPGTIRNLMTQGKFPSPVPKEKPGPNYWRLGDIRAWLKRNRGRK